MEQPKVFALVKQELGNDSMDPLLIMAIIVQESAFDQSAVRMENGFRERYLSHITTLPTSSAILLSSSYGLMQVLGEVLLELGYFEFFHDWYSEKYAIDPATVPSRSQMGIVKGIDEFMLHPEWQIRWGIKHFNNKMTTAHANQAQALLAWNGGAASTYPLQVQAHYLQLKNSGDFT